MNRNLPSLLEALQAHPVIAAVRTPEAASRAAKSPSAAVFLLGGSIFTLPDMVQVLHHAGKQVFLHLDLAEGLGRDDAAVLWSVERLRVDGVISTRTTALKCAQEAGALTIQRLFLMDSSSFERGKKLLMNTPPDMAEVLPGIAPKGIRELKQALSKPVIAGGMVSEPEEIAAALSAGATAVSVSDERLWAVNDFSKRG